MVVVVARLLEAEAVVVVAAAKMAKVRAVAPLTPLRAAVAIVPTGPAQGLASAPVALRQRQRHHHNPPVAIHQWPGHSGARRHGDGGQSWFDILGRTASCQREVAAGATPHTGCVLKPLTNSFQLLVDVSFW